MGKEPQKGTPRQLAFPLHLKTAVFPRARVQEARDRKGSTGRPPICARAVLWGSAGQLVTPSW